jgi:hypothetical protein
VPPVLDPAKAERNRGGREKSRRDGTGDRRIDDVPDPAMFFLMAATA